MVLNYILALMTLHEHREFRTASCPKIVGSERIQKCLLIIKHYSCAVVTRLEICASLLLVICIGGQCNPRSVPLEGLIWSSSVAMVSRVYALWWNASPSVVYSVICLWIIHFGTFAGMMLYAWATAIIASNSPPFTGCLMMPKVSHKYCVHMIYPELTTSDKSSPKDGYASSLPSPWRPSL